jgi:hypothetical protein
MSEALAAIAASVGLEISMRLTSAQVGWAIQAQELNLGLHKQVQVQDANLQGVRD